jgi:hypothetical protein
MVVSCYELGQFWMSGLKPSSSFSHAQDSGQTKIPRETGTSPGNPIWITDAYESVM